MSVDGGFVCVWRFTVAAQDRPAFLAVYGPGGAWDLLFGTADGYRGTELLRDRDSTAVYVTIDRWTSAAAYRAFRASRAGAYADVDAIGSRLTQAEEFLGNLEPVRA